MPRDLDYILETLKAFWEEVKKAVLSVPPGTVATYGDLAEALGERGAARAIPAVLQELKQWGDPFTGDPLDIPIYRFVRSDGWVKDEHREALRGEGVEISPEGVVVSLHERIYREFSIKPVLLFLKEIQREIGKERTGSLKEADDFMAVDVAYKDREACVCGVLFSPWGREEFQDLSAPLFPYIPGYLFFREGVLISNFLRNRHLEPSVIIVDGHGILHPRGAGLATHLGSHLKMATIGVAKRLLVGSHRGIQDIEKVLMNGVQKGWAVRKCVVKGRGSRYLYVSPGWGMGLQEALKIYLKASRVIGCEPVEVAHRCATRWRQ